MLRGGGPAEFIEGYVEPLINFIMDGKIPVAEFPGGNPLLQGSGFRGGTVFIGSADIDDIGLFEAEAKTSADRTWIKFPKWGTLLT